MLLLAAERSSGDKNILSMELKMYGNGSQLLNIYFIKLSGSTLHVLSHCPSAVNRFKPVH